MGHNRKRGHARVIADERLLENQMARQREESSGFFRCAQESLLRGDEPAARRALLRRSDREKLVAALNDQLDLARTTGGKIRRQLDAMRVRRAEAERRLHVLVARQRTAETQREMLSEQAGLGTDDTGFARFDRMCRKIERTEAEADALFELAGGAAVDEGGPPSDQEVEDQLHALRQKCQSEAPA
jgi:phage shock protein A